jgi:hypothetical protein
MPLPPVEVNVAPPAAPLPPPMPPMKVVETGMHIIKENLNS